MIAFALMADVVAECESGTFASILYFDACFLLKWSGCFAGGVQHFRSGILVRREAGGTQTWRSPALVLLLLLLSTYFVLRSITTTTTATTTATIRV